MPANVLLAKYGVSGYGGPTYRRHGLWPWLSTKQPAHTAGSPPSIAPATASCGPLLVPPVSTPPARMPACVARAQRRSAGQTHWQWHFHHCGSTAPTLASCPSWAHLRSGPASTANSGSAGYSGSGSAFARTAQQCFYTARNSFTGHFSPTFEWRSRATGRPRTGAHRLDTRYTTRMHSFE